MNRSLLVAFALFLTVPVDSAAPTVDLGSRMVSAGSPDDRATNALAKAVDTSSDETLAFGGRSTPRPFGKKGGIVPQTLENRMQVARICPVRRPPPSFHVESQGAAVAAMVGVSLLANRPIMAEENPAQKSKRAWTLKEAQAELLLSPRDPYLQYVVLQLARRENKQDEVAKAIEELLGGDPGERRGRTGRADLFSIFTGALAVQESLQLDTMRRTATVVGARKAGRPVHIS
jgi:hypothetical protein